MYVREICTVEILPNQIYFTSLSLGQLFKENIYSFLLRVDPFVSKGDLFLYFSWVCVEIQIRSGYATVFVGNFRTVLLLLAGLERS